MQNSIFGALLLMVSLVVSGAVAQDRDQTLSAEELLTACSREDPEWIGFCHGYIQAISDAFYEHESVGGRSGAICPPPGTSRADLAGAFVRNGLRHLRENDDLTKAHAASVVYATFVTEFPCD